MIVPMKKASVLVLHNEQEKALEALRKLGVLHIEKREASSEKLSSLRDLDTKLTRAQSLIEEAAKNLKKKVRGSADADQEKLMELVNNTLALAEEKDAAKDRLAATLSDITHYAPWGNFNPADIKELAEKGVYLFPVTLSEKSYRALPDSLTTVLLSARKKLVRCVIISEEPKLPIDLPDDVQELEMPAVAVSELEEIRDDLTVRISDIEEKLASFTTYIPAMKKLQKTCAKEIEFEVVRAGMPLVELNDKDSLTKKMNLAWLSGYLPTENEAALLETAKKEGWACVSNDPTDEDIVPTQLKHNRFVNLLTPLTEFLGTIPYYTEPDISLWFLLFFGIFFAMIFGDAGYGSVLVLISAVMILKAKKAKKEVPLALKMFLYLGFLTVIWGTIVCNWFGLAPENLPVWLQNLSIPGFSNLTEETIRNKNQMHFCFILGLIQLTIGHIIGIKRSFRSLKVFGEIGSLAMLYGIYFVVLNLIIDSKKYPINSYVIIAIVAGFILNFIFSSYETSIRESLIENAKNSISMFLGVVNIFADIMSYIRLWAVGLAGGAISATVNAMAGPALGSFLVFFGVLLLLFGHGLNYIMNVLSVIVHGVRLNTLEFSNHVGLAWAGIKYEPFSDN
ncbi:V-type ATP synthase subunit I [Treponema phagedenis]|uniref:V-type ATP synthase subunit I n=1 Tax=Treponema phagedenis TaxID=162 RepID=UPI0001F63DB2|nr:V-type ATPase 116kDa subunit family protein [Treponema phagedenis]EFW38440.1 putative V-type sodium ATPase, I subunit [Treponema phagedenis F0421]TYT78489.1 V-type ATP synthase subunit I [Treponema phagedenis]